MDVTEMTLTTFAAPLLKTDDILLCLHECGIQMTEAELNEPQRYKDQIKGVFLSLLVTCMGISTSDLIEPAGFAANQCLSNPALYEDAVSEVAFLRATMKLMRTCGVMDFGLKDFQHPTSRRLKKQLSSVINLIKFREDRLQMYHELSNQREQIMMDVKEALEENEMVGNELEEQKVICAKQKAEIEQIENDIMELENQIAILNKQQGAIRLESGNLKKSHNQLKDEAATAIVALQEAQAQLRELECKVVKSPEKKKQELIATTQAIDVERKSRDEAEAKVLRGKTCLEYSEQTKQNLLQTEKIFSEAFKVQDKIKELSNETQKAKENIRKHDKQAQDMDVLANECRRDLQRNDERISRLRNQGKAKKVAAEEAYEDAQKELILVEKEKREGLARIEAIQNQVEQKARQAKAEEEMYESEISKLINISYKSVEEAALKTLQKQNSILSAH